MHDTWVTTYERLAWVEVSQAAIETNTRRLRALIGPDTAVLGVTKADAYGHGSVLAAWAMLAGGAAGLAVATTREGQRLRDAGIRAPILVLGPTPPDLVEDALEHDLALTVASPDTLHAAAYLGRACGRSIGLHLKIDTGMHRLGLLPHDVLPFMEAHGGAGGIRWDGVYTHFACADEPARPETGRQIACFDGVLASLQAAGWSFPQTHAANSAGALAFPGGRYNAVRAGIALYGVAPGDEVRLPGGFAPALAFNTRVMRVADLAAGSQVSYGGVYVAPGPRRIATVAAGYADGVRRAPAWREVLVRGRRARIVGRICMDYAMVDVTHIPSVAPGDLVTLLGAQGQAEISAEEVAAWLGTSAYEVLTTILPGEPRLAMEIDEGR